MEPVFEQVAEPAKITKRRGRSAKGAKALVNVQSTRQNNKVKQAKEAQPKRKGDHLNCLKH